MALTNTNSWGSVHTDTHNSEESLSYHIRRIEQENDRQDRDNVANQLRRMSSSTTATSGPQSQSQSQSVTSIWHMTQYASNGLNGTPTGTETLAGAILL